MNETKKIYVHKKLVRFYDGKGNARYQITEVFYLHGQVIHISEPCPPCAQTIADFKLALANYADTAYTEPLDSDDYAPEVFEFDAEAWRPFVIKYAQEDQTQKAQSKPKKTYDLRKMWVVWVETNPAMIQGDYFQSGLIRRSLDLMESKEAALRYAEASELEGVRVVAITKATATEFEEGQGINDD